MPMLATQEPMPDVAERTPQQPQTQADVEQNRQEVPEDIQNALRDLVKRS